MRESPPALPQRRYPTPLIFGAVLAVPLSIAAVVWVWYDPLTPKRFAPVVEGRLYRSGLVTPEQLEHLAQANGIRNVICLLNASAPETLAEKQAAEKLGVAWHNVALPGDGASTPEQRDEIRRLLDELGDRPTLVHCAAGSNRTGLAIGMYRLHKQGWALERVMSDMRAMGFEDKPKHQDLRDALAAEAALAARLRAAAPATTRPVRGNASAASSDESP